MLEVGRSIAEHVPVVVMCYANPILARGLERFADALVQHGASGLIVPDLPLEEAARGARARATRAGSRWCRWSRRPRPTSGSRAIGAQARGFVYTVSLTGTTGERAGGLQDGLAGASRVPRAAPSVPVAVGFGISTPEQAAAAAAAGADGVIVGSRLVRAAGRGRGSGGGGRRAGARALLRTGRVASRLASLTRWA